MQSSKFREWLIRGEIPRPELFFGDQSAFSRFMVEAVTNAGSKCHLDTNGNALLTKENVQSDVVRKELTKCAPGVLIDGYRHFLTSRDLVSTGIRETFDEAVQNACNAISYFNESFPNINAVQASREEKSNPISLSQYNHTALLSELSKLPITNGFLIVSDLFQKWSSFRKTEHKNSISLRSATTPILFSLEGTNDGMVLWLTVELDKDFVGLIIPDVLPLGLTNVTGLLEPLADVWEISGLMSEYRCRWRINTVTPTLEEKLRYEPKLFPNALSGCSLQAAALAAMWAASGRIPYEVNSVDGRRVEWFSLNDQFESFRLHPKVAISAALDITYGKTLKKAIDSIPLRPIDQESALPKANAMANYRPNKQSKVLFDMAILCTDEKDRESLREAFPKTEEQRSDYEGIEIIDDCKTIGDALNWLLEVNIWKHTWNQHCQAEWESQWGWARDADGKFLDIHGNILADQESETGRVKTGSLEYMHSPVAQTAGASDTGQDGRQTDDDSDVDQDIEV